MVVVGMGDEQEGLPAGVPPGLRRDRADLLRRERGVAQQHVARGHREQGVRLPERRLEAPDTASEILLLAHRADLTTSPAHGR